jgi:hypothetical protein
MKGYRLVFFVFIFWLILFFVSNLKHSVFLSKKERINILFYGKKTIVFSLGFKNNLSYLILYPANLYLEVPGGYGFYRVGGLGKLAALEKNPNIFKKTFSSSGSFFLDLYFYQKKEEIYYGKVKEKNPWPNFSEIFFTSSNANFFDRIFCFYYLILKKPLSYQVIEVNEKNFDRKQFLKNYQGLFYKKTYRQENLTVQIFYTKNYNVADLISQILEGEGIRVVDISNKENDLKKGCRVYYSSKNKSQTVLDIGRFFDCFLEKKETPISDIIVILGSLEKNWEVGK